MGATIQGNAFARLWKLIAQDRKDIGFIYVYALLNGIITLALPLGIQAIVALIAGGQISSSWALLTFVVVMGAAFSGILKIMQFNITEAIQQKIFARVSFEFALRIPRLKSEDILNEHPPELVNRFFDVASVQKALPKVLTDFSTAALEILFGLILLSLYHPSFIIFSLTFVVLIAIIFQITFRRGLNTSLEESNYKYKTAHWLEELARTMNSFKLAGRSSLPVSKVDELVNGYLKARKSHYKVLLFQFSSIIGFKVIITGGLLILGSVLVINNQINLGQFVASEIIIILIIASAEKLVTGMEVLYDLLTSLEKIGFFTDLSIEQEKGVEFKKILGDKGIEIEARELSYKFSNSSSPVIEKLSFHVHKGERICISGYSGSGKTTLVRILNGLFENFTGLLNYNGLPRKNINIFDLRTYIGDYSAVDDIFIGSLMDNITAGHKDIDIKEVVKVSNAVHLTDFIQTLPEGYDTILQPKGARLPGSVVRKIILARSIVTNPHLLIIEEFFSKLQQSEKTSILNYLTDREKQWTLLMVSNDSEVAKKCDHVWIMSNGRIVDVGPFEKVSQHNCFHEIYH